MIDYLNRLPLLGHLSVLASCLNLQELLLAFACFSIFRILLVAMRSPLRGLEWLTQVLPVLRLHYSVILVHLMMISMIDLLNGAHRHFRVLNCSSFHLLQLAQVLMHTSQDVNACHSGVYVLYVEDSVQVILLNEKIRKMTGNSWVFYHHHKSPTWLIFLAWLTECISF